MLTTSLSKGSDSLKQERVNPLAYLGFLLPHISTKVEEGNMLVKMLCQGMLLRIDKAALLRAKIVAGHQRNSIDVHTSHYTLR